MPLAMRIVCLVILLPLCCWSLWAIGVLIYFYGMIILGRGDITTIVMFLLVVAAILAALAWLARVALRSLLRREVSP